MELGTKPTKKGERDAIHLAVIAVEAGQTLSPGNFVGLIDGVAINHGDILGIVDPFLDKRVPRGDLFWLCLFPNSVTGMKHQWEHPAFDLGWNTTKRDESEAWIRNFIESHGNYECPPYGVLIESAINNRDGMTLHINGYDAFGKIPIELWDHLEVVTGMKFENRPTVFSCSC